MTMTTKQRKFLIFCAAFLVVFYVVRPIIIAAMRAAQYQRQVQEYARQKAVKEQLLKKKAAAEAPAAPPAPLQPTLPALPSPPVETVTVDPGFVRLAGVWRGNVALSGRGICGMFLEIRNNREEPEKFIGFPRMTCLPDRALTSGARTGKAAIAKNRMDPEAAVLIGKVEDGAIRFTIDKTIGADSSGCAFSSYEVTPFGAFIDAAWKEDTCSGGHVILRRMR